MRKNLDTHKLYVYNIHMNSRFKFEWDEQKNLSNQENVRNYTKGEVNMDNIEYTDAPKDVNEALMRSKVLDITIDDLIKQNRKERVTIMIDKENLEFFRTQAKAYGIPYQTMINNSLTATRSAIQKQAL